MAKKWRFIGRAERGKGALTARRLTKIARGQGRKDIFKVAPEKFLTKYKKAPRKKGWEKEKSTYVQILWKR